MRRFAAVFLASFVPSASAILWFAFRAPSPLAASAGGPILTIVRNGAAAKNTEEAVGAVIRVYEGDRLVAEITGGRASVESRRRALFEDALIVAYPDREERSRAPERVLVRARRAEVDREGFTAKVEGEVRIESSEGDTLAADDLLIRFGRRVAGEGGKERVDRGEKTIETKGPVEVRSGESWLRGRGFFGHLTMRTFRFERDVEGSFFGSPADWSATTPSGRARPPEDVTFRAGGPVSAEPLPAEPPARRTRLALAGGVDLLRIDPESEHGSRVRCRDLAIEFRRDIVWPDSAAFPMDPVAWQRRGLGLDPMPAPALWPQARARLERLDAAGDASLSDARIEMEGDVFSTEMKADGAAVTVLSGPKKRILLKERGGLSLGAFAGRKREEGAGGPVEVTAIDDIRIERGPDGPNGEPGPAAASLARWVRVREGARELTADALALTLQPSKEGGAGYVPGRLEARGNVRLKDGARGAQADEADWDAAADRVELRASTAAEAYDGETRLRAPRIAFDNRAGTLACDAPVAAQGVGGAMAPGEVLGGEKAEKKGEDREWKLTCGAMTGRLENGEMRELNAAGPVEIVTGDSHTTADRLEFDGRRVRLHGRPLRMTAGADVVEAAFADIHSRDGAAVLRGVKEIRLNVKGGMDSLVGLAPSASAEGAPDSPIFLTCRGPVTFDRARGLFTARDEVLVRAPEAPNDPSRKPGESRLEAERLFLFLDPATRKLAAAEAWGRVVLRSRDAVGKGDRLLYDVPSGTASFTGTGKPLLWKDGSAMRVDEILISDGGKTIKFLARHSAGSISFPDKGGGGAQGRNFMRDPFGGLMPEKKIVPNGKDRK